MPHRKKPQTIFNKANATRMTLPFPVHANPATQALAADISAKVLYSPQTRLCATHDFCAS
jgi:hypothetical protein